MANIHTSKLKKYYDQITQYYAEGKGPTEIVKLLNTPDITKPSQISKIAGTLGLTKSENNKNKNKDIDIKAIKLIKDGYSHRKAAKILGIDQQSMSSRLKKYYGIYPLLDGKKEINQYYFHDIDTEEKAYWLGFMYADGYINEENNSIELTIKESDKEHLEKFKKCIDSKHKISKKKILLKEKTFICYRISIKDKQLISDLIKHGCIQKKSFIIDFPIMSSLQLYKSFVRGYFDGDGSVGILKNNDPWCSFTSGSIKFLEKLQAFLLDIVRVETTIKKIKNENAYDLRTKSKYEAFHLIDYLYKDATIYLSRKYEKYLDICRLKNLLQKSSEYKDGIKREWRNVS